MRRLSVNYPYVILFHNLNYVSVLNRALALARSYLVRVNRSLHAPTFACSGHSFTWLSQRELCILHDIITLVFAYTK